MWIYNENEATASLYEDWMDEYVADPVADLPGDRPGVEFSHPTQIVEDVGEQLIDRYAPITQHNQ